MKGAISSILTFVIYISLIGDYCLGVFHSFTKHGIADGAVGTVLFPWAMYRGVEFWWHDDYGNVNWDKRLSSDLQTCIFFVNSVNEKNVDRYQKNEDLEKFSEKINDYPLEKKQYLIDGTRKFIYYSNSLIDDFSASLNEYKKKGKFDFILSISTKKLESELSKFDLKEDIDLSRKAIEELNKEFQNNLPNDTTSQDFDKIKNIETSIKLAKEMQKKESKRLFKYLFNQEL